MVKLPPLEDEFDEELVDELEDELLDVLLLDVIPAAVQLKIVAAESVPSPWKPKVAVAPGGMLLFQPALVAV
nr:hypothetical protein [Teredinibacter turnerae]